MPLQASIALITIWTDDVPRLVAFYRDALGMEPLDDASGSYVEFRHPNVRFAICARRVMVDVADVDAYHVPPGGQRFELAFPVATPAEVDTAYAEVLARGATPVAAPRDMPWGQRTALFADPDGNIHELFADLPAR